MEHFKIRRQKGLDEHSRDEQTNVPWDKKAGKWVDRNTKEHSTKRNQGADNGPGSKR